MRNYFSISNMTAGFIGVLVGFTGSAVLVFEAASTAGASQAEISSWLLALSIGISITCIGLSLRYRIPILTGWSTPGAALLITNLTGISMAEAIGAFIFSALLTILVGISGLFEKVMSYIPRSLSAAMLAGILINFGIKIFSSMQDQFILVSSMFIIYLIGKRIIPRYVIIIVLCIGVLIAWFYQLIQFDNVHITFPSPVFTMPVFSIPILFSVGFPLFIITMSSQNIPGALVIYNSGYSPPISPLISWTGLITMILAPFGCYGVCLAAITAAICTGEEADCDPNNRYKATVFAGICWIIIGAFGATIVTLFHAFPKELVLTIAGLALLSTIANSLKIALEVEDEREAALITILASVSGLSLYGIGSACCGLLIGSVAMLIMKYQRNN
ncbi:MAG: benzoate/H(+) symporter BenE family transporter [Legionella sp.]